MAWDDVVFGVVTGGLYNVGKTVYQAGDAAEQAGDAVEEIADGAGNALAVIGSTFTRLGQDLSSFLKELEQLLTVKRAAPRNEDDLWDEEVERLAALRQMEADLVAELEAQAAGDDDRSWFDSFFGAIFGQVSQAELATRTKLAVVRSAIHEILYEEPGVVPTSIHNLQLILERFNTLEQPRLEEILDSVNNNLEESVEILQEVKKLFVVRTWRAVTVVELAEKQRQELERLEASLTTFDTLISKNTAVSGQLRQALVDAQPAGLQLPKMVGTWFGRRVEGGTDDPGGNPHSLGGSFTGGEKGGEEKRARPGVLPSGPSLALKGKVSAIAAQPMAISVATGLKENVVSAYLDNYHLVDGRLRYYVRERLKVEKAIYRIQWVPVEEPGVIPRMLEEIKETIARFRTESQPRVERMLDSLNTTVSETTAVLQNVNRSLGSVQAVFDFLGRYSLYIKIGLAVAGGLMLLILLMGLIVLVRAAFNI